MKYSYNIDNPFLIHIKLNKIKLKMGRNEFSKYFHIFIVISLQHIGREPILGRETVFGGKICKRAGTMETEFVSDIAWPETKIRKFWFALYEFRMIKSWSWKMIFKDGCSFPNFPDFILQYLETPSH